MKFVGLINLYISSLIKSKKNFTDEILIDEKIVFFIKNFYHNEKNENDLITSKLQFF